MLGKEKKEELLSSRLFSDILNYFYYSNEKIRESKDTHPSEELQELELAI